MDLLSLFKRESEPSASKPSAKGAKGRVAAVADDAAQARLRARRRLIGAAVLVVLGVIGFPLIFGTQPRPIAPNVPVEIIPSSSRSSTAEESVRAANQETGSAVVDGYTNSPASSSRATQPRAVLLTTQQEVLTETAAEAGREVTHAASQVTATVKPRPAVAAKVIAKPPPKKSQPQPQGEKTTADAPVVATSADPSASSPVAERFVVQVGAFADAASAKEARVKAEKKGLKTYTQLLKKDDGRRIRVRIGPFDKRSDADAALAKARAAGLNGTVLVL